MIKLFWIAGIAVALATAGFLHLPPREDTPETRRLPDESQFDLEEKTGFYRFETGDTWVATRGAVSGLNFNRFAFVRDSVRQQHFTPLSADRFLRRFRANRAPDTLTFTRNSAGSISGVRLQRADGTKFARKDTAAPYTQQEISYRSGEIRIAAVMLVPHAKRASAGIVFVHGSGASDRDSFWYLHQAHYFASQGFLVLLPDKRGCGRSEGVWQRASFADLARDAVAGVAHMRASGLVDSSRIGLLGISQGGWIAPLAVSMSGAARFVISASGSLARPDQQLQFEVQNDIVDSGAPAVVAAALAPAFSYRAKRKNPEWWQINGGFEPVDVWKELQIPALFVFGEKDRNVDVARSRAILGRLRQEREKADFAARSFPELGHGLLLERTGWLDERYLATVVSWIALQ